MKATGNIYIFSMKLFLYHCFGPVRSPGIKWKQNTENLRYTYLHYATDEVQCCLYHYPV